MPAALTPGFRYMLLSGLAFSVMGVFVKLLGERLPTAEIVMFRAIVSLLLSYVILRRVQLSVWGERQGLLLLRGLFGSAGLLCVFYALTHMPLGEATVIQYLHPLFTALLGVLFLRERVSLMLVFGWVLSIAGVAMIAFGRDAVAGVEPISRLALLAAIGGAFFSGCAYVTVRKLAATENPHVIVFYFPLVALPVTLPLVIPIWVTPQGVEWFYIVGVGVCTQLGQIMLTKGMQQETAAKAAALSYLQVIFAAAWGVLLFSELVTPALVAGASLVLIGALANAIRFKGRRIWRCQPGMVAGNGGYKCR